MTLSQVSADPLRLSELARTEARLGIKTGTRDSSVSIFAPPLTPGISSSRRLVRAITH